MIPLRAAIALAVFPLFATAGAAETVFTETFDYGPGVPDRDEIHAGDFLRKNNIFTGDAQWETPDSRGIVFAPGKGLAVAPGAQNASIYIQVDPEWFVSGAPVEVELEVIPGNAWLQSGGVRGVWLGFANMDSRELLASIKDLGDNLSVRDAVVPESSQTRVDVTFGTSGESRVLHGAVMPMNPEATCRMTLTYDPADRSFTAGITDLESNATETISDTLAHAPDFSVLRVDFTGLDSGATEYLPVIKSISLKKQ